MVPNEEKVALLQSYLPVVAEVPEISDWEAVYLDTYTEKWFWSSLGADLHFDHQRASLVLNFTITAGASPRRTAFTPISPTSPAWPAIRK